MSLTTRERRGLIAMGIVLLLMLGLGLGMRYHAVHTSVATPDMPAVKMRIDSADWRRQAQDRASNRNRRDSLKKAERKNNKVSTKRHSKKGSKAASSSSVPAQTRVFLEDTLPR